MASIKIPESGIPIIQFCGAAKDRSVHYFFPTYAHLVIFAACVGYSVDQFDDEAKTVRRDPDPVGIEIVKNQNLYDPLLVLALAQSESYEIVEDEDKMARIVEGYASAGFRYLTKLLDENTEHGFLDSLVKHALENIATNSEV